MLLQIACHSLLSTLSIFSEKSEKLDVRGISAVYLANLLQSNDKDFCDVALKGLEYVDFVLSFHFILLFFFCLCFFVFFVLGLSFFPILFNRLRFENETLTEKNYSQTFHPEDMIHSHLNNIQKEKPK
jgi:hypothetical protein